MKRKLSILGLFLAGLVLLQQGIALGNGRIDQLKQQSTVVAEHDLDPSALFYTEVALALQAEKTVRNTLKGQKK